MERSLREEAEACRMRHLVVAVARNDVASVGQLLGSDDVNEVKARRLPDALVRKGPGAPLLDIAVGCGSVDVTKCLLEFHRAKPSREALKIAISGGSLELVRLVVGRLPESELELRIDLAEIAAEFHQLELLATRASRGCSATDQRPTGVSSPGRQSGNATRTRYSPRWRAAPLLGLNQPTE